MVYTILQICFVILQTMILLLNIKQTTYENIKKLSYLCCIGRLYEKGTKYYSPYLCYGIMLGI